MAAFAGTDASLAANQTGCANDGLASLTAGSASSSSRTEVTVVPHGTVRPSPNVLPGDGGSPQAIAYFSCDWGQIANVQYHEPYGYGHVAWYKKDPWGNVSWVSDNDATCYNFTGCTVNSSYNPTSTYKAQRVEIFAADTISNLSKWCSGY